MTIGVADTYSRGFENYVRWLQGSRRDVDWCKLSYLLDNLEELNRCDGFVLTGGGDVDPVLYGRSDALPLVEGVDLKRDKFEMELIARAVEHEIPTLGICRGMQIANVAMGGTLIPDVRSAGFKEHRNEKGSDGVHPVIVEQETLFREIVGVEKGQTNTNHHQAVDCPGDGLRVTVRSADGLVEALEWEDAHRRPWLQLVQWHPERMRDVTNPFSGALRDAFLQAVSEGSAKSVRSWKQ